MSSRIRMRQRATQYTTVNIQIFSLHQLFVASLFQVKHLPGDNEEQICNIPTVICAAKRPSFCFPLNESYYSSFSFINCWSQSFIINPLLKPDETLTIDCISHFHSAVLLSCSLYSCIHLECVFECLFMFELATRISENN